MMSTAILMAMGAEQSSKQPVAHEVEQLEGTTFAQALDARVATPANLEKVTATRVELPNANGEVVTKSMAHVPELAIGTKAKVLTGQATSPLSGSKGVNTGTNAPIRAANAASPGVQAKTEDMETPVPVLSVNEDQDSVQAATVSKTASTANSQGENVMPQELPEDQNQIQIPGIQTPAARKEIAAAGSAEEAAPAKKTAAKTEEGGVLTAAAAKNGAATVHPLIDEIKSTHEVVQMPVSMTGQVSALAPVVANANSITVEAENEKNGTDSATVTGASSAEKSTIAGSGSGTSSAHAVKAPVADVKTELGAPGDSAVPAKSDVKAERVEITANVGSDAEIKARTAGDPVAAVVHTQTTGADTAAGAIPLAVGLAKLPIGEASAHANGSPNFLNEQNGSGGVGRSMEPMPRTLSATPTALEVGIPDGTHGWLKVRAEMADGGVVNASVSAASQASQEMLHRELPSLTAYLQSEKVAVNTVVVHSGIGVGAESQGNLGGTGSGGAGQPPQKGNEGGGHRQSSASAAVEDVAGYEGLQGVGEDGMLPPANVLGGGSWLSVRA
jgi:hypothetical protein